MPALVWQFFSQFADGTPPGNPPPGTGACRVSAVVSAWNTGLHNRLNGNGLPTRS